MVGGNIDQVCGNPDKQGIVEVVIGDDEYVALSSVPI